MAGYDCKFVEEVGREYKCKKCSLVAKKATLTDCCGETFCEGCIVGTVDHKEPCPHCGQKQFQYFNQVKYQQHICSLQVFCSVKERGCEWTGRLDQLATHLDPDQNNCQFVDTSCPLCCGTVVPRKKLEEHVTKECVKREHFCQYCSFKASFEEIEGQHIPVCKYVPLQCPNRCGVTFEREDMEHHMKMCLKQEIPCEFSSAGCEGRFNREDLEKHNRDYIQKHVSMLSRMQQKYQEEAEKKLEELAKLMNAVEKRSVELEAHEEKLKAQEEKLKDQRAKLEGMQQEVRGQVEKLQVQEAEHLDIRKDLNSFRQEQNRKDVELERVIKEHEKTSRKEREQLKVRNLELLKCFFTVTQVLRNELIALKQLEHQWQTLNESLQNITVFLETRMQQQWQKFNTSLVNKSFLLEIKIGHRHDEILGLQHQLEAINGNLKNLTAVITSTQRNISSLDCSLQKASHRIQNFSTFKNGFKMRKFSGKRSAGGAWTSPAMYTHVGGYKFVIHVYADGKGIHRRGVRISSEVIAGEFDDKLEWPVTVWLSAHLLRGGHSQDYSVSQFIEWKRPSAGNSGETFWNGKFCLLDFELEYYFICHYEVEQFLAHDSLSFKVFATIY